MEKERIRFESAGTTRFRRWRNDWNSPSEAKADANPGLMQSRRPRPVCVSPIVSADPAVNVNAGCINAACTEQAATTESAAVPTASNTAQPSHFTEAPCDGDPPPARGRRCSCGGRRVKLDDPQPGICSLNRGFCSCRRSLSPEFLFPRFGRGSSVS